MTPTQEKTVDEVIEEIGIATYGGVSFEPTGEYREKLTKILTTYAAKDAEIERARQEGRDAAVDYIEKAFDNAPEDALTMGWLTYEGDFVRDVIEAARAKNLPANTKP